MTVHIVTVIAEVSSTFSNVSNTIAIHNDQRCASVERALCELNYLKHQAVYEYTDAKLSVGVHCGCEKAKKNNPDQYQLTISTTYTLHGRQGTKHVL
jgi:hypothetical protein